MQRHAFVMDGWSWIEVPRIFKAIFWWFAASVVLHELGHGIMAFILR